jgi:hypothetical protein
MFNKSKFAGEKKVDIFIFLLTARPFANLLKIIGVITA